MIPNTADVLHFLVEEDSQLRLDVWLADQLDLSRSQSKKLIDQDLVTVNGNLAKARYLIQQGDLIIATIPQAKVASLEPEAIPLDILYEDSQVAVINKPKGLVVHPGPGNLQGTLVNALLAHLDELADISGENRPGIVHRLDKDTSGLMMIAKTNDSYTFLAKQLKSRTVERHYLALVQGVISASNGCIDQPIARHPRDRKKMAVVPTGREAKTLFDVEERFIHHSLVKCSLVTGRTHQIRVHMAKIHHPLVGDGLYGFKQNNLGAQSQVLHANFLAFKHPNGSFMEFECEPDAEFLGIVKKARLKN